MRSAVNHEVLGASNTESQTVQTGRGDLIPTSRFPVKVTDLISCWRVPSQLEAEKPYFLIIRFGIGKRRAKGRG